MANQRSLAGLGNVVKADKGFNLNNLYGLIPPLGRRRLFWPGPAEGRRGFWSLFVNWSHMANFSGRVWA